MDPSLTMQGLGDRPIIPIADLQGSTKYSAEEIKCRNKLACLYRVVDFFHWSQGIYNHISFRLPDKNSAGEEILINPLGLLYKEISASSFAKITVEGRLISLGSTELGINQAGYILHSAIHRARPDVNCVLHVHTSSAAAVSAMRFGLRPLVQEAMLIGPVAYHEYEGALKDEEERELIAKNLGDKKVLFLRNHGFAACGTTIEEAFHLAYNTIIACHAQVRALSAGLDNCVLPSDDIFRRVHSIGQYGANGMCRSGDEQGKGDSKNGLKCGKMEHTYDHSGGGVAWGVGELEWEAHMRLLDEAGYETGYEYRLPKVKNTLYRNKKMEIC